MPDLKFQDAKLLFSKIHGNPQNYDLKIIDGIIMGNDDEISFRLYKNEEKVVFEVIVSDTIFTNSTGEWKNAIIMLESAIKKMQKEHENQKIQKALDKLRNYLSEKK